ncbi:S-adenosyl-L-methionine-dependent methyltransferase [Phaeosphaeriaceae sp. PMI808]|nr:S-adenosyl-L-methionine-dependent methyltransferase [Phaeosphaeriaceae sp. PMI808]
MSLETTATEREAFDVLDVGCGSGSWAIDLALRYPHLSILGVDITPPMLPENAQTSNVTFLKADIEQEWGFAANRKFRYIHGRMLQSGIHDWPALLQRCWQHLTPGGWLELIDVEHPFRCDALPSEASAQPPFIRLGYAAEQAWKSNGLDYRATLKHEERFKALGFQGVSDRTVEWPLGSWEQAEDAKGSAGDMILANFSKFIAAAGTAILGSGKAGEGYAPMSAEAAQELVSETITDLEANWMARKYWLCM